MFIRKVPHKNRKNRKEYYTYKLVDSIRTERGPRQRDILNMGVDFDLPKEEWKYLVNCIEEILTGQKHLIDNPEEIRRLAGRYARKIIRGQGKSHHLVSQENRKDKRRLLPQNRSERPQ